MKDQSSNCDLVKMYTTALHILSNCDKQVSNRDENSSIYCSLQNGLHIYKHGNIYQ